jgi:hypothetical protein
MFILGRKRPSVTKLTNHAQIHTFMIMKITAWKLVAYDEDDKEFNVDVHSNDVAYLIEDFLSEQFGEINDE